MTVYINRNRPELWDKDIQQSVSNYNSWFMSAAPAAYQEARSYAFDDIEDLFTLTNYLHSITPEAILSKPSIVSILRLTTSPPIARDRLMGLANTNQSIISSLEKNKLPSRLNREELFNNLDRICKIVDQLLDRTLFSWIPSGSEPTHKDIEMATIVLAERKTKVLADPLIRNIQEQRQLAVLCNWLEERGYDKAESSSKIDIRQMDKGTYAIHKNVPVFDNFNKRTNMPLDVVIQPFEALDSGMPLLIEAKSAGDTTNTNKRRKEEAHKIIQLRNTYGNDVDLILFLSGYFDENYLDYEASVDIDWVWEHRVEDLSLAGI